MIIWTITKDNTTCPVTIVFGVYSINPASNNPVNKAWDVIVRMIIMTNNEFNLRN